MLPPELTRVFAEYFVAALDAGVFALALLCQSVVGVCDRAGDTSHPLLHPEHFGLHQQCPPTGMRSWGLRYTTTRTTFLGPFLLSEAKRRKFRLMDRFPVIFCAFAAHGVYSPADGALSSQLRPYFSARGAAVLP